MYAVMGIIRRSGEELKLMGRPYTLVKRQRARHKENNEPISVQINVKTNSRLFGIGTHRHASRVV